jgi:hypothetical protein
VTARQCLVCFGCILQADTPAQTTHFLQADTPAQTTHFLQPDTHAQTPLSCKLQVTRRCTCGALAVPATVVSCPAYSTSCRNASLHFLSALPCLHPVPLLQGYCCSQAGFCSQTPDACSGTCQCDYSGVGSLCQGSFPLPLPNPALLPEAQPVGVCGSYVATCPNATCCSQFGFCLPDGSPYCQSASCDWDYSPRSQRCKLSRFNKQAIVRHTLVLGMKNLSLDGFVRLVSPSLHSE